MVQFSTFVRGRVALAAALVLAAPLAAQGKGSKDKKPKKGGEPAAAAPAKVKDDAVTAKDKAIVALDKFSAAHKVDTKRDGWRQGLTAPEQQVFAKDREYQWHLETNKGELTIRLRPDVAPMHVTSAIYLTRLGYYDGLTFHRVIKDFMAQGGCPLGNGNGGPGYTMAGEFAPDCKHDKPGILSTANEEGKPHTDGSQFFLTFVPTPHLDGKHTIFGEVTGGLDVLEAIAKCAGGDSGVPTEKLAIVRAWVVVVDPSAAAGKDAKDAKDKGADGKSSGGKAGGGKDAGKGK